SGAVPRSPQHPSAPACSTPDRCCELHVHYGGWLRGTVGKTRRDITTVVLAYGDTVCDGGLNTGKAHMRDDENVSEGTPAPSTDGEGTADTGSAMGNPSEDPGPIDIGPIWRNRDPWKEAETREAPQGGDSEDPGSS